MELRSGTFKSPFVSKIIFKNYLQKKGGGCLSLPCLHVSSGKSTRKYMLPQAILPSPYTAEGEGDI